jgi:hypothetical protein
VGRNEIGFMKKLLYIILSKVISCITSLRGGHLMKHDQYTMNYYL